MNLLGIEMKQVVLSGELNELLLEVLVGQQRLSLLTHKHCSGDGSTVQVQHCVCDGQRAAAILSHDAMDQRAAI